MEHVSPQMVSGAPHRSYEFSRNLATCQEGVSGSRLTSWVMIQSVRCWSLLLEVAHASNGMSPIRS